MLNGSDDETTVYPTSFRGTEKTTPKKLCPSGYIRSPLRRVTRFHTHTMHMKYTLRQGGFAHQYNVINWIITYIIEP